MRTLSFIEADKQIRIARETMDLRPAAERRSHADPERVEESFEFFHGEMRQSILTRLEFLTSRKTTRRFPSNCSRRWKTLVRVQVTGRLKSPYSTGARCRARP